MKVPNLLGHALSMEDIRNSAGNCVGGMDFGTLSHQKTVIANASALLSADGCNPPFDLYLHPDQYYEAIMDTDTYNCLLRIIGGSIYMDNDICCGHGVLIARLKSPHSEFDHICNITGI